MIAIKRLQSIMWILVIAAGALSAYLISLRVATERNAVASVERQIYATRSNIRYLEVEFSARASMRQLAAWNAQDIRYSVPGADQYLSSERQLATLDNAGPSAASYVAPPVMAAASEPATVPAMIVPVKAEAPRQRDDKPIAAPVRVAVADTSAPKPMPAVAIAKSVSAPRPEPRIVNLVDKVDPDHVRKMRLDQLEAVLTDMKVPARGDAAGKAAH